MEKLLKESKLKELLLEKMVHSLYDVRIEEGSKNDKKEKLKEIYEEFKDQLYSNKFIDFQNKTQNFFSSFNGKKLEVSSFFFIGFLII